MTEHEEDVMYAAYLGLRVLKTMCEKAGLQLGVARSAEIIASIEFLKPEYPARLSLREGETLQ